jgi:molybdopterin-containing oxidoreductase family membrane subunit
MTTTTIHHSHRLSAGVARSVLVVLVLLGSVAYGVQCRRGLGVTDLSREMPWGLYISQFTFLVGLGASAVTVLLPYYVHRQRVFARALVLGELVAVIAVTQALAFVMVDLGKPSRVLNVLLYPAPSSLMFWDCLTLGGYWLLSVVGLGVACSSRAPRWSRPLALATVPWAIAIHVVTALLYSGLAARPGWMTAVLAPRFLATAFASGPALLILLAGSLARTRVFDIGRDAVDRLMTIMTYAAATSVLLALLEAFSALYSGVPAASEHLRYLYMGLDGHFGLVPWTMGSWLLMSASLVVLLVPPLRRRRGLAHAAALALLVAIFIDKGLCFVTSGFNPSPLGYVRDYRPSLFELGIAAGIYAAGALAFDAACRWILAGRDAAIAAAVSEGHEPDSGRTTQGRPVLLSTAPSPDMVPVASLEK